MNCEEAFKKLYKSLNKETDSLVKKDMEKNMKLAKLCCNHCQFNDEMKKIVQTALLQEKAPSALKNKIMKDLRLPD